MSRLLHHHHRLFPRPNGSHLRRLLDGAVSTYGRQGSSDRGVLVPEEVDVQFRVRGDVRRHGR